MNNWKKVAALTCSVSLVITSLTGCAEIAKEADSPEELVVMEDVLEDLAGTDLIKHSSTAGKEETVYVMMDADGNHTSTIVSEWLKNPNGSGSLSDRSSLNNIHVVKGSASYTKKDDQLTWSTDGSDVYYQGESEAELPVTVKVSYELDGRKVRAEELDGASGHLKITFDYENNTATERVIHGERHTIYQPFTVASGMLFGNDKVENVEVSNGKIINSGDLTIAFGMAMPGLAESLGLDDLKDDDGEKLDIDIPTQVVVDADVTDFSLMMTLSLVSNNALEELGLDDFNSLDDLKEKMGELTDGMDDIIDGATQVDDGVGELSDGTGELADGTDDLTNGATDLSDGAHELLNGTYKIKSGANKVKTGTEQVDKGANDLKNGIDQLKAKTPELAQGVTALSQGADQLNAGMKQITENNDNLNNGAASLATGLSTLNTALSDPDAQAQLAALTAGSAQVKNGLAETSEGLTQIVAGYDPEGEDLAALITTLEAYADSLIATGDPQNIAMAGALKTFIDTYKGMYGNIESVQAGVGALNTGYAAVDAGITSATGSLQTTAGYIDQLSAGAADLQTGVSGYTAGVNQVAKGATQLQIGLSSLSSQLPVLVGGIDQLSEGAGQLTTGTGSLAKGAKDLANGSSDLADGALDLAEGAGKLSDGTQDLKDGVKRLADGVAKLWDGTGELKDGVIRFNDDGVSKIAELVNEDIEKYYDRLCAVRDYAKEYNSFAGCSEDTECSVQFIYKTEGIGE